MPSWHRWAIACLLFDLSAGQPVAQQTLTTVQEKPAGARPTDGRLARPESLIGPKDSQATSRGDLARQSAAQHRNDRPADYKKLVVGDAVAQPSAGPSYDTAPMLEYGGLECTGVVHCKTVEAGRHKIDVGQARILMFDCPSRAPYFVGWDTEQNQDIQVTALPPSSDAGAAATPASRLVVLAENVGAAAGHVTMYLGCSPAVADPIGMMRQRTGIRPNRAAFLGGN